MSARSVVAPATVLAGGAAGLLVGAAIPSNAVLVDPDLVLLLRFMAGIKGAAALGVTALGAWRVSHGPSAPIAAGHASAAALMSLGAGLIWTLAHVALGAAVFYAGVAVFVACGWSRRGHVLDRAAASRRRLRYRAATVVTDASGYSLSQPPPSAL